MTQSHTYHGSACDDPDDLDHIIDRLRKTAAPPALEALRTSFIDLGESVCEANRLAEEISRKAHPDVGEAVRTAAPETRPRKPRKRRPATVIKQIEKDTGKTVTSYTAPDGTTLTFDSSDAKAQPLTTADDELERWRRKKDAR